MQNNRVTMTHNQNGHQGIMCQKRHNEPNEYYPPPPKLTTFAIEEISGLQAQQQQSYHYMVITNVSKTIGLLKCSSNLVLMVN